MVLGPDCSPRCPCFCNTTAFPDGVWLIATAAWMAVSVLPALLQLRVGSRPTSWPVKRMGGRPLGRTCFTPAFTPAPPQGGEFTLLWLQNFHRQALGICPDPGRSPVRPPSFLPFLRNLLGRWAHSIECLKVKLPAPLYSTHSPWSPEV